MTDIDKLFIYRMNQAEETLSEARKMMNNDFSARSIVNRAYYSMFYAVLALLLKTGVNINTSKHTGIISIFDKEFVKTGKFDKSYSKILHDIFDSRQEGDYKELAVLSHEKAVEYVNLAGLFLKHIKNYVNK